MRCFTCGKQLADKWEYYSAQAKKIDDNVERQRGDPNEAHHKNLQHGYKGKLLDEMGLERICCRRHMLSHVDLIDVI